MRVVIFHPGAIGDVVLATPVARALKEHFQNCLITHITHESLFPLLRLSPFIDELLPARGAVLDLRAAIKKIGPVYTVNLASSFKSKIITWLSAPNVVHYKKEQKASPPMMHAVENFLDTLTAWKVPAPVNPFPTFANERLPAVKAEVLTGSIAFAPGVGDFRPHRAWPEKRWIELGKAVSEKLSRQIFLVGGEAERELCARIASQIGKQCVSLAGSITLPETAAVLAAVDYLISGDTGPAHIAVAVGTRVIGLYGPTFPERSGPYGTSHRIISVTQFCECKRLKECRFKSNDGRCMDQISYETIYELLAGDSDETVAKSRQ